MRYLATLAVLLALPAWADDTLTWLHPIEYVPQVIDGVTQPALPLDQADIAFTVIRYGVGTQANPPTTITALSVPAPATTYVVTRDPLLAGTVCYQAATLMKPVPPDTTGAQSNFAPSSWVCKTQVAAPKKPKPPRNLNVT